MSDQKNTPGEKLTGVLHTGTGAGILVALAVIAIFILAATFLKSLVFGIILACFFLPLEKFFEKHFFQWRGIRACCSFFDRIARPFRCLKDRLAGKNELPPEEAAEKKRQQLVFRACVASALAFLLTIVLVLLLLGSLLIPAAVSAGKKLQQSQTLKNTLERVENAVMPRALAAGKPRSGEAAMKDTSSAPEAESGFRKLVVSLRRTVPEYLKKNHKEIANLVFRGGRGLVSGFFAALASFGSFAFDLLLCAFFFFFFLQHLALFKSGSGENETIGSWCVRGIFGTRWMPSVSENTRAEAVGIIDRITEMFVKWIHGYLWIIIIETLLYLTAFSLLNVPYAPLLAFAAGLTILLPFLGPIASFLLTSVTCLVFCREHLVGMLIGVGATYLLINGLIEQLFLYPKLIGKAMELTTVETIIAVLLGGLVAGIPGMILAVPAAAVLKYLVPKIYQSMRKPKK